MGWQSCTYPSHYPYTRTKITECYARLHRSEHTHIDQSLKFQLVNSTSKYSMVLLHTQLLCLSSLDLLSHNLQLKDGLRQASAQMPSPPQQPAVTLTFDLQNLIRPSVRVNEYSLHILSRLLKPFMRYRCNKIYPDKWTNRRMKAVDGQPENIMPSPKLSGGKDNLIITRGQWPSNVLTTLG